MQASISTIHPIEWQSINPSLNITNFKYCRRQLHQAIQLVSATSRSLLPSEERDEQSVLYWMPKRNLLTSKPIGYNHPHQLALDLLGLRLVTLNRNGEEIANFPLSNKSQQEALQWINQQISTNIPINVELPYELPFIPMAPNQKYSNPDSNSLHIACACFTNASLLFGPLALEMSHTSLPSCQPESFDFQTLSLIDEKEGVIHSIEFGMSLGDTDYPLPYFYVCPKPAPEAADLPYYKGAGKWHTFPWTGLVLNTETIYKHSVNSTKQQIFVENFLKSAYETCLKLF